MVAVTVALVDYYQGFTYKGLDKLPVPEPWVGNGPDVQWGDRSKHTVDAHPAMSLLEIAQKAGSALGVGENAFLFAIHDPWSDRHRLASTLTTLDPAGRIKWYSFPAKTSLVEALTAYDAGVLEGDPRRLYLARYPQIGNGWGVNWADLIETWSSVYGAIETFVTLGEAGALTYVIGRYSRAKLKEAKDAIASATRAMRKHSASWADPVSFNDLLARHPWYVDDLAALLAAPKQDLEAIFRLLGFSQTADGSWTLGEDDDSSAWIIGLKEAAFSRHDPVEGKPVSAAQAALTYVERTTLADSEVQQTNQPPLSASEMALPVSQLMLKCECPKPDCQVMGQFSRMNGLLKQGFTEKTDHFVADPRLLAIISEKVSKD